MSIAPQHPYASNDASADDDDETGPVMPGAFEQPRARRPPRPVPVVTVSASVVSFGSGEILPEEDAPPAFPALNSIQRSGFDGSGTDGTPKTRTTASSIKMPPPSIVPVRRSQPGSANASTLAPSVVSSSLAIPGSSIVYSSSGVGGLQVPLSTLRIPPNTNSKAKARKKVALEPGHSPLDWARLKSSGEDLRAGVTQLLRVTTSELKEHNTRDDAWSTFDGKVYNITPYIPFHPGGEKELMRVAGRDGSKLFALTHSWVNLDYMLDGCMVGILVRE